MCTMVLGEWFPLSAARDRAGSTDHRCFRRGASRWCALALGVAMSGPAASVSRRQPLLSLLAGAMRALNRVTSFVPPPPSDKSGVQEKIVVVQVHPNGKDPSFTLALGEAVRDSLKDAGAWGFVEIMNIISTALQLPRVLFCVETGVPKSNESGVASPFVEVCYFVELVFRLCFRFLPRLRIEQLHQERQIYTLVFPRAIL